MITFRKSFLVVIVAFMLTGGHCELNSNGLNIYKDLDLLRSDKANSAVPLEEGEKEIFIWATI